MAQQQPGAHYLYGDLPPPPPLASSTASLHAAVVATPAAAHAFPPPPPTYSSFVPTPHDAVPPPPPPPTATAAAATLTVPLPYKRQQHGNDSSSNTTTALTAGALTFATALPRHYVRTSVLLALALLGVTPLLSGLVVTVLLCGAFVLYLSDFLGYQRGTVLVLLLTTAFAIVALFVTNMHLFHDHGSGGVDATSGDDDDAAMATMLAAADDDAATTTRASGASALLRTRSLRARLRALALVSRVGPLLLLIDFAGLFAAAALAALLHFRWLQRSFPALLCLAERVSLAVTPVLALPSLLASATALAGARRAPGWLLLCLCVEHYAFYGPLPSSFLHRALPTSRSQRGGDDNDNDNNNNNSSNNNKGNYDDRDDEYGVSAADVYVDDDADASGATRAHVLRDVPLLANGRVEAVLFTLLLLLLPAVVYNAMQNRWLQYTRTNIVNTVGLVLGALTYLCIHPAHSLWFLLRRRRTAASSTTTTTTRSRATAASLAATLAASSSSSSTRAMSSDDVAGALQSLSDMYGGYVLVISAFLAVHWLAYRLLHCRFAHLFDGVPAPYNAILLVVGLYGVLACAYAVRRLLLASAADDDDDDDDNNNSMTVRRRRRRRTTTTTATATTLPLPLLDSVYTRIVAHAGALVATLCFCALLRVPLLLTALTAHSLQQLHLFLLRGGEAHHFVYFAISFGLQLMYWMAHTSAFGVTELHVFGEPTAVPMVAVSFSILVCYALGCACFAYALTPHMTRLTVCLFAHALQLGAVEHVLYLQPDEDAYSGVWVLLTSVVGVAVAYRLHRNRVLRRSHAALVAACYVAKLYSFLVEVTSAAYYAADVDDDAALVAARLRRWSAYVHKDTHLADSGVAAAYGGGGGLYYHAMHDDDSMHDTAAAHATTSTSTSTTLSPMLLAELTLGWWAALVAAYALLVFELGRRKRVGVTYAYRLALAYMVACAAMSVLSLRNVQRAVYDTLTRRYATAEELYDVAPGLCLLTYALLTMPLLARHATHYLFLHYLAWPSRITGVVGVLLLTLQPTMRTLLPLQPQQQHDIVDDVTSSATPAVRVAASAGRAAVVLGVCMLFAGSQWLLPRLQRPRDRATATTVAAGGGCARPRHRRERVALLLLLRALYWLTVSMALAYGATSLLLAPLPSASSPDAALPRVSLASSLALYGSTAAMVLLLLLTVDMLHYRELQWGEALVVYALSVCFAVVSATTLVRRVHTLTPSRPPGPGAATRALSTAASIDVEYQCIQRLLAMLVTGNLFVVVLLHCRHAGRPLLPRCVRLTTAMRSQLACVNNYAVVLLVSLLCVAQYLMGTREPALYVMFTLLLLLLLDDTVVFAGWLSRGNARYLPVVAAALLLLWADVASSAWQQQRLEQLLRWRHDSRRLAAAAAAAGTTSRGGAVAWLQCLVRVLLRVATLAPLLLPGQVSLLHYLWRSGKSRAAATTTRTSSSTTGLRYPRHGGVATASSSSSPAWLLATMLLAVTALLTSRSKAVQWMSIVTVCGQGVRLFSRKIRYVKLGVEQEM